MSSGAGAAPAAGGGPSSSRSSTPSEGAAVAHKPKPQQLGKQRKLQVSLGAAGLLRPGMRVAYQKGHHMAPLGTASIGADQKVYDDAGGGVFDTLYEWRQLYVDPHKRDSNQPAHTRVVGAEGALWAALCAASPADPVTQTDLCELLDIVEERRDVGESDARVQAVGHVLGAVAVGSSAAAAAAAPWSHAQAQAQAQQAQAQAYVHGGYAADQQQQQQQQQLYHLSFEQYVAVTQNADYGAYMEAAANPGWVAYALAALQQQQQLQPAAAAADYDGSGPSATATEWVI